MVLLLGEGHKILPASLGIELSNQLIPKAKDLRFGAGSHCDSGMAASHYFGVIKF